MVEGLATAPVDAKAVARAWALQSWIAADPKTLDLLERAKGVATSRATVLICGESGVGKHLLASVVHCLGANPDEPLTKIDCAALPPALIECELFGWEHEASSGGFETRRGALEMAGRGTLVLEDIAALPMPLQSELLHVMEEKQFKRLGALRTLPAEARIIALSSVDLERAVSRGTFREDLYYRLNVVPLLVPPLRERPRDIRLLTQHFFEQLTEIHRNPHASLLDEAIGALERHSYPGNVRELRNIIERIVMSGSDGAVMLQDLPQYLCGNRAPSNGQKQSLEELEREYIAEILGYTGGRKTKAAAILGISRKTLLEKRKRYGLG